MQPGGYKLLMDCAAELDRASDRIGLLHFGRPWPPERCQSPSGCYRWPQLPYSGTVPTCCAAAAARGLPQTLRVRVYGHTTSDFISELSH
jgi:hypothetical protein